MTQDEMQKYWDACLIKQWRLMGTVGDLFEMYRSIVGRYPLHGELMRMPELHRKIGVRIYVDKFLPKLNDLLWKVEPEKDVRVLDKLTKSRYDKDVRGATDSERERNNARRRHKTNVTRVKFESMSYRERNADTDGNVVKSSKVRVRRVR